MNTASVANLLKVLLKTLGVENLNCLTISKTGF